MEHNILKFLQPLYYQPFAKQMIRITHILIPLVSLIMTKNYIVGVVQSWQVVHKSLDPAIRTNGLFHMTLVPSRWLLSSGNSRMKHLICNHFFRKVQKSGSTNSDFFFWSTIFLKPDFSWIYGIKPPFFSGQPLFSNQISETVYLEPYF